MEELTAVEQSLLTLPDCCRCDRTIPEANGLSQQCWDGRPNAAAWGATFPGTHPNNYAGYLRAPQATGTCATVTQLLETALQESWLHKAHVRHPRFPMEPKWQWIWKWAVKHDSTPETWQVVFWICYTVSIIVRTKLITFAFQFILPNKMHYSFYPAPTQ